MGLSELEQEWQTRDVLGEHADWDSLREEAAPHYRQALDDFIAGTSDIAEFRTRIDSLSKTSGWWGFRGSGGRGRCSSISWSKLPTEPS